MCGIAGFISRQFDQAQRDTAWLSALSREIAALPVGADAAGALDKAVRILGDRFDGLMSFATAEAAITDDGFGADVTALAEAFAAQTAALTDLSRQGRTELDPLIESLRDYEWQLREELAAQAGAAASLVAGGMRSGNTLKVALGTEAVLRSIDRLEVRGRDSAGIAIQLQLAAAATAGLTGAEAADLADRSGRFDAEHGAVYLHDNGGGRQTATFVFKTANLVGRLGDNGAALRDAIRSDRLLWTLAGAASGVAVLSHTRWASHGVISVANCHPHNQSLVQDRTGKTGVSLGAMYALNGDVDNHVELAQELVANRQAAIDPAITTDAKIIPIAHRTAGAEGGDALERFRTAVRRLDGSIAVGCIDPSHPGDVFLAQKGSGQGLHAARLADGWIFASEVYGLCNLARSSFNLARRRDEHVHHLAHRAPGGPGADRGVELRGARDPPGVLLQARIVGEVVPADRPHEALVERRSVRANHHALPVLARIGVGGHHPGDRAARGLPHVTAPRVLRDRGLEHAEDRLVEGRVDHLAAARALRVALVERREHADRGVQPRERVAEAHVRAHARARRAGR